MTARPALRDPFVLAALGFFALIALLLITPVLTLATRTQVAGYWVELPFLLLALIACWRRDLGATGIEERRFWRYLALGVGSWVFVLAGRLATSLTVLRDPRYGLVQDLLYLAFYLCLVLALEQRPERRQGHGLGDVLRRYHSLGATLFAFTLLVYFAVLPGALNPDAYGTRLPSRLLYVALDVYLIYRLVTLARRPDQHGWETTYRWLLAAVALWTFTSLWEVLAAVGVLPRVPYGTPLDLLWLIPLVTLVAAVRSRGPFHPETGSAYLWTPGPDEPALGSGPLIACLVGLPLLHFGLYGLGLLDPVTKPAREVTLFVSLAALALLTWVTERRIATETARLGREAMERRQQAQRLAALGQLAAGIAHDFNNLLTIVVTSVGFVKGGLREDQAEARADLQEIEAAARRGGEMVRRLIAFGRRRHADTERVDLGWLVTELSRVLRRLLPETIQLEVEQIGESPEVIADDAAVEQILVNLLNNARDAMPAGGTIRVTVGRARIGEDMSTGRQVGAPGMYGFLAVSDTGTGMNADTRERMFEPFFTTKEAQGSGLGLAMVADLVRLHRGFAEVDTVAGHGTTVTVYFRLTDAVAHPHPHPAPRPSPPPAALRLPHAATVLVVEDEAAIRAVARRTLEAHGYRVIEAADGAEGLALFRSHAGEIQLVVSDIVMPRMGGPELYQAVRRESAVPFMLMTGYADLEIRSRVALDPPLPVIHKPWTGEDLLRRCARRARGPGAERGGGRGLGLRFR